MSASVALAGLLALGSPAVAQIVRYVDGAGTHYVASETQIPERFRANAVTPKLPPAILMGDHTQALHQLAEATRTLAHALGHERRAREAHAAGAARQQAVALEQGQRGDRAPGHDPVAKSRAAGGAASYRDDHTIQRRVPGGRAVFTEQIRSSAAFGDLGRGLGTLSGRSVTIQERSSRRSR